MTSSKDDEIVTNKTKRKQPHTNINKQIEAAGRGMASVMATKETTARRLRYSELNRKYGSR